MSCSIPRPFRARGFTLIELMIVLAILGMGAVYAAQKLRDATETQMATASADNIATIGKAVTTYISNNTAALSGAPTTAVTVAELQAVGTCGATAACLASTFGPMPWMGGYATAVRRIGASTPYQFDALVCTNNAWSIGGQMRVDLVGKAVQTVGGAGGMTYDATGAVGNAGSWSAPVAAYPAANAAGKLCYYVSQSLTGLDQLYLRTDGSNQMSGALRMNGNAIQAATSIDATGNVTTTAAVQAANVVASNNVTATGLVQGDNVTAANTVTAGTVTSTGNINVGAGGSLQSTGRLHIQAGESLYLQPINNASGAATVIGGNTAPGNLTVVGKTTAQDLEASNNVQAANDVVITSLTSRANAPTTTSIKTLVPKLVEMANQIVTAHGQSIATPACPSGGTPQAFILPHVSSGIVNAARWGTEVRLTGPAGGVWTVVALDGAGAAMPNAQTPNFAAIVRSFCTY